MLWKLASWTARLAQGIVDFAAGLAILVLLATFALVSAVLLAFGFIGYVLMTEARDMWDTALASIRSARS
jgi:hypothetical protein